MAPALEPPLASLPDAPPAELDAPEPDCEPEGIPPELPLAPDCDPPWEPPEDPCDPPCEPLCEPGIERLPPEDETPPGMEVGIEAPEEPPDWPLGILLPLEPDDPPLGMLELLPPPLEPDEPPPEEEEPEEPPEEEGILDGMLLEDWPAQPPIRNADTEPINVACTAMASSRFIEWPAFIALSLMRSPAMQRRIATTAAAPRRTVRAST